LIWIIKQACALSGTKKWLNKHKERENKKRLVKKYRSDERLVLELVEKYKRNPTCEQFNKIQDYVRRNIPQMEKRLKSEINSFNKSNT